MRALLLALYALISLWRAESHAATRCTARACFTLHAHREPFDVAKAKCFDSGGYLLTMRHEVEAEDARALLELASEAGLFASGQERLWIGLKLEKGNCVLGEERLRGFRWLLGDANSGAFSNWGREPHSTCTEERCVSLRAAASSAPLYWSDGSCKESALYACQFQFKGMCEPLALAGPGEVTYNVPFSQTPLKGSDALRMLPHATFAEVNCTSSSETQESMCRDANGAFIWTRAGPFCASGEGGCAHQNGGCSHWCMDDQAGGVRCACPHGYDLGKDTVTCFSKDPCRIASCEHKCVIVGTDSKCACLEGFRLAPDWKSCVDEDECERDVCDGHKCHNRPGSFECECKRGFRKDAGGACEDIDECAGGACGGHARCLNSQGSFSCYCATGFRSSEVSGECVDVDECLSRPCEHVCTNTEGSYACSCRADFRLAENGISCLQVIATTPRTHSAPTEAHSTGLDQSTTSAASAAVMLTSESSSTERREIQAKARVWVWVLGSVIPLLLLVALTSVVAALRWKRSRRHAKKKGPTADSYCWVSSGFQAHQDTEAR